MCRITKVFLVLLIHKYFGDCFMITSSPRVLLSVYYESEDEASEKFILGTLVPAVLYLQDHVTLRMVPFGNAKTVNYGSNGYFVCPHGPTECYGNLVQDCTLNLMYSRSSLEKVNYIACEMKTKAATQRNTQCIEEHGVSKEEVAICITSQQGLQLQMSSEYLTRLVKPNHLPVVTIDGEVQQFQSGADSLNELLGSICSKLQNMKVCLKYFNKLALKQIINIPLDLGISTSKII